MSVLPLKPDIDRSHRDVCLMPTADISWVCSAIDSRSDRTVKIREFVPHSDKKRVTIERHCCRESHPDAEEMTVSRRIAAGETGRAPAPKEQPPRKLSGR